MSYNPGQKQSMTTLRSGLPILGSKRLAPGTYQGVLDLEFEEESGRIKATFSTPGGGSHVERWRLRDDEGNLSGEWRRFRAGVFPTLEAQKLLDLITMEHMPIFKGLPVTVEVIMKEGIKVERVGATWIAAEGTTPVTRPHKSLKEVEKHVRHLQKSYPTINDVWSTKDLTNPLSVRCLEYGLSINSDNKGDRS